MEESSIAACYIYVARHLSFSDKSFVPLCLCVLIIHANLQYFNISIPHHGIVPASRLLLACLREIAHSLEIADDAGHVVDVLGMAMRALLEIALVDVAAVIADGVRHIEGEIVATLLGCHLQKLAILLLGQVLLQVHVQGRTACKMLDIRGAMELELLDDVCIRVLHDIEIAVVAIAGNEIAVFPIPLGMLHTDVLGRYHLAVEKHILGAIELVILLDKPENCLHKL